MYLRCMYILHIPGIMHQDVGGWMGRGSILIAEVEIQSIASCFILCE
jgi:hypothetical protein